MLERVGSEPLYNSTSVTKISRKRQRQTAQQANPGARYNQDAEGWRLGGGGNAEADARGSAHRAKSPPPSRSIPSRS